MRATSTIRAGRRRTSADARRLLRRLTEAVGRRDVGYALLVAASASAAAVLVFRLWRADLHIPFAYYWDSLFNLMTVKGLLEHGGYQENPSLGAPFGQELYDFALATERPNLWLIEGLGFLSSDPAVVMNLFFLLTFPLTALSAFLCLRLLGVSTGVSTVCSLLYSLAPYHFWRGQDHLFLSAYYSVPLGAYLVVAVLSDIPLFVRRLAARRRVAAYASGRSLLTIGFCLVLGSAGIYYAAFTLVLLAAATVLASVARRARRPLATGGALIAVITATAALNLVPTIRYQLEHGRNSESVVRTPQQTETFSLVPVELMLPSDDHRIGFLAERKRRYIGSTLLRTEHGQSLGLVATIGLLWLVAIVLLTAVRPTWRLADNVTRSSAVSTLVAILVGTIGGVSSLVAYLVTPELRAWNRISIFIAFFALVAVAQLLERARRRLHSGTRGRAAFAVLLGATLAVGALDQTSDKSIPAYADVERSYRHDAAFVEVIEGHLPPGSAVFQLPHMPFPETTRLPGTIADYDLLRAYLHSRDLRWSYGAVKGRPEDWAEELHAKPLLLVVPAVAASGFEGIYVDRAGYADGGRATEAELRRIIGATPLASPSGRQLFFDLRQYAQRLRATYPSSTIAALRVATLHPVVVRGDEGFSPPADDGTKTWRDGRRRAQLRLVNPLSRTRDVTVAARIERPSGVAADMIVSFPDGVALRTRATPFGTPLSHTLEVPPGTTFVRFAIETPPDAAGALRPASPWFRLVDFTVTDAAFEPFLATPLPEKASNAEARP
jgi:hypothetical protein